MPQEWEFKYLGILFTSDGRMAQEMDKQIRASSAVMKVLSLVYASASRRRRRYIEHSKFCVKGTRCSAIHHSARGVWLCVCVVSGVIADSLLFLPVTVNSKQWQPRWSSCICSWSSSILKSKCLYCKCWSAGDREDVCRGGLYVCDGGPLFTYRSTRTLKMVV